MSGRSARSLANEILGMNDIPEPALSFIEAGTPPRRLAVRARQGASPGIFWLSGFNSDMRGTKAVALDAWGKPLRLNAPWWFWNMFGEQGVFLLSRKS